MFTKTYRSGCRRLVETKTGCTDSPKEVVVRTLSPMFMIRGVTYSEVSAVIPVRRIVRRAMANLGNVKNSRAEKGFE